MVRGGVKENERRVPELPKYADPLQTHVSMLAVKRGTGRITYPYSGSDHRRLAGSFATQAWADASYRFGRGSVQRSSSQDPIDGKCRSHRRDQTVERRRVTSAPDSDAEPHQVRHERRPTQTHVHPPQSSIYPQLLCAHTWLVNSGTPHRIFRSTEG